MISQTMITNFANLIVETINNQGRDLELTHDALAQTVVGTLLTFGKRALPPAARIFARHTLVSRSLTAVCSHTLPSAYFHSSSTLFTGLPIDCSEGERPDSDEARGTNDSESEVSVDSESNSDDKDITVAQLSRRERAKEAARQKRERVIALRKAAVKEAWEKRMAPEERDAYLQSMLVVNTPIANQVRCLP